MPINEERLSKLRDLGLSEYTARAYLALLDLGGGGVREISSLSRVPSGKLYHVLERMHEKGLVRVLPEYPRRYVPLPFTGYLDALHREHEEALRSLEARRDDLADDFSVKGEVDVDTTGGFTVLRGRRNVSTALVELADGAERHLLVSTSRRTLARGDALIDAWRRAAGRGVRVRVLLPHAPEDESRLAELRAFAEVRERSLQPDGGAGGDVAFMLADDSRGLLAQFVPDDARVATGKDVALTITQAPMVAAARAFVDAEWALSAPAAATEPRSPTMMSRPA